ncbi:hypothetical protein K6119_13370 [Paracrocinitomix mangrovi]|uniref:hypothetical protein n=1 Tax=Paracrocinitomix mangrovi TaxID=2862509 RepID=UPI001C8E0893|nr:hypothetical protein [Paracrocinitomix mangrovi]UKN00721.1 hypothetical protein K6119_13370 [Paracrocinitomix mangrovi]
MKKVNQFFFLLSAAMVMASCNDKEEQVEGWKPIYSDNPETETVNIKASEPLENPGRIYVYENLLMVNDQGKGIHIYDNTNVSSPIELSFIGISGNMDFSVKADRVYADNGKDMVIVDITNPAAPTYSNRIKDIFPKQVFPDEFGPFECVDESKGTVVGWEKAMLDDPKCFR